MREWWNWTPRVVLLQKRQNECIHLCGSRTVLFTIRLYRRPRRPKLIILDQDDVYRECNIIIFFYLYSYPTCMWDRGNLVLNHAVLHFSSRFSKRCVLSGRTRLCCTSKKIKILNIYIPLSGNLIHNHRVYSDTCYRATGPRQPIDFQFNIKNIRNS